MTDPKLENRQKADQNLPIKFEDPLNTTPCTHLHWVLINQTEKHFFERKLEMYHESLYTQNDWTQVGTLEG